MLLDIISLVLLFLPGILLLYILSSKLKFQINMLEIILFGSVIWNYAFIALSVLLGLITNLITSYFIIFDLISVGIVIISSVIIIRNQKLGTGLKFFPNKLLGVYGIGLVCLLILSFFFLFFHSIFVEWDAVYCYIPSAKAINLCGNITTNSYRMLNFFDASPAIPIIYALMLQYSGIDSLYLVPLSYFMLTLIAVLLISRRIFSQDFALISTLIFVSLPIVTMTISSRALYLDIAFFLYLLTALYAAMNLFQDGIQSRSYQFNGIVFVASFTLMFLTKSEFGLLLTTVAIAILVTLMGWKYWRMTSVLLVGIPYYLREMANIVMDGASWILYAQRLLPVILISLFMFAILKFSRRNNIRHKKLDKRFFLISSIVSFPAICYLFRNIMVSGFIYPGLPLTNAEIMESLRFFNKINPSLVRGLNEVMQWHNIISVWWSIAAYIIPFSIGIISVIYFMLKNKQISIHLMPLLCIFFGLFILWSQLGCDPQPRRLYIFTLFAALTITYGLYKTRRNYDPQIFALRVVTYVIVITSIIWMINGIETVNELAVFYGAIYKQRIEIELIAISTTLFLIVFAPYELIITRITQRIKLSKKAITAIFSCFVLMNFIFFSFLAAPMFVDVASNGFTLRYNRYSGWYYYPDVVDYYNENVTDSHTTLGFYCNELITFANRTVIDLYIPTYASTIYSIIEKADITEILDVFGKLDIKYFLEPKPGNPFFPIYEKLVNSTVLGNILVDNPQLQYLATFKYATLYAFHENYTATPLTPTQIAPWNYNPETNYTLTIEPNTTKFTATTNTGGRISLIYTFNQPQTIKEALWLTIKSYNQSKLVVILFSNLQNRTTDFFSYQCPLTNQTRKPVINLKEGTTKGNFNQNHIEAILIGIETQPNTTQTFEIHQISTITYNNQC